MLVAKQRKNQKQGVLKNDFDEGFEQGGCFGGAVQCFPATRHGVQAV